MQENEACITFKRSIGFPIQYPHYDNIKFYPCNNIYPKIYGYYFKSIKLNEDMKDYESLYQYQEEDKLLLAVYWLQEKRITDILQNENNYNTFFVCDNGHNLNPIEILCRDRCGNFYYFECNKEKYFRIVKQLAKFNSSWVTSKCFLFLHDNKLNDLIELLLDYSKNNENICYICLNSEPICEFLNNVCKCKNPIHINCLKNCLKNLDPGKNNTCTICLSKYKINEGSDSRIFFPFDPTLIVGQIFIMFRYFVVCQYKKLLILFIK
jgi:hypothetical protein